MKRHVPATHPKDTAKDEVLSHVILILKDNIELLGNNSSMLSDMTTGVLV